jgi:hypothetical protein
MSVCRDCKHLITETPHVCPTEEYLAARDELFDAALEAEELFGVDELEQFSSELARREGVNSSEVTTEPTCAFCSLPITRGAGVFYRNEPYHPGCAVAVAKEKRNGRKTDDTRRSKEGHEAGAVTRADPAGN